MSYPEILRDKRTNPIPQYYDPVADEFKPLVGAIGEEGNAWNNEATGENGVSAAVDTKNLPHISIMGVVDAATNLSFEISQDGETFYFCGIISDDISPQKPPGQQADFPAEFHIFPIVGGRYIRIRSSENVTATVTIAAKL